MIEVDLQKKIIELRMGAQGAYLSHGLRAYTL